ncbi:hypothetical protein B566_EDAN008053 [Ephemera danica]|nr:hypothetical protein B566_EDAN008053 [Ephemera danica]
MHQLHVTTLLSEALHWHGVVVFGPITLHPHFVHQGQLLVAVSLKLIVLLHWQRDEDMLEERWAWLQLMYEGHIFTFVNLVIAKRIHSLWLRSMCLILLRFYALAAAAALLKYVELIQNQVFAPRSLEIEYQGSNNTMLIDVNTAQRLELVRGASRGSGSISLFSTLNLCRTVGGVRLLRASLLQPPCLLEDIEKRLVCVQELVDNPSLYHNLQDALTRLADCEQLLALSMAAPTTGAAATRHAVNQLNYVLLLKSCLDSLPQLAEALADAQAPFFCKVREKLQEPTFNTLKEQIVKTLHDDAHSEKGFSASNLQRCFAVRTGIHGLLDVARKTYCELVDEITSLVNKHKEECGLPLRVGFSATRGFHIQLPILGSHLRQQNFDIPPVFIQVHKTRSLITMTTQELVHRDQRCKEALNEIQTMSNVVLSELLTETRQHASSLYQLCEAVSQLDLMLCLAGVSVLPGYVKPRFGPVLELRASRHPILTFIHHTEPIPNDIFASEEKNFHVITGPNMGGKSIYLKQVALLQILAQMGCFVPAESATFRLCDRIFSRIGFDDSMETNASTFALEIREMKLMLESLTPCSLLIVDELCRGTSVEEGTSVAWALCEQLLDTKAFTFFTTHFLFLTKLEDLYPNVTNHHMQAEEVAVAASGSDENNMQEKENRGSVIQYTHRLEIGVTKLERYGLKLAQLSGIPKSIIAQANELMLKLSEQRKPLGSEVEESGQEKMDVVLSSLCTSVLTAERQCGSYSPEFINHCKELQEKFILDHPDFQNAKQQTEVPQVPNETSSEVEPQEMNENHRNLPSSLPTSHTDEGGASLSKPKKGHFQTSQSLSWQSLDKKLVDTQTCSKSEHNPVNSNTLAGKVNQLREVNKDNCVSQNVKPLDSQVSFKPISSYSLLTAIQQQYQSDSEDCDQKIQKQPNVNKNKMMETVERKEKKSESQNSSQEDMDSDQELVESPSISPYIMKTRSESPSYSPLSEVTQNTASCTPNRQSQQPDIHDKEEDMEFSYSAAPSPSNSPIHDEHFPNTFTQISPTYSNSLSPDMDQEPESVPADDILFRYPPIKKSTYSDNSQVKSKTELELDGQSFSSLRNQQCSKNVLTKSIGNTSFFDPAKQCGVSVQSSIIARSSSFIPAKTLISSEILKSISTPPVQLKEPCETATTPEDRNSPNLPYQPSPIIKCQRRVRLLGVRPRFSVPVKKTAVPVCPPTQQNTALIETCLKDSKSNV